MATTLENNKRIAKNTVFLSIRMLMVLLVSLYTSRIVLDALGVEDFGIYNVVGGIVSLFAFMNGAMSNATQRYIAFELGKSNPDVRRVFSSCMMLHFFVALFIFVFSETVGLYLLNHYLTIPDNKLIAANWVYQFSIVSCLVMVVNTPYNGAIVAYERMQAFAYISLIDVCLRLGIAFLVVAIPSDRLILYALFLFVGQFFVRLSYTFYCRRYLSDVKFSYCWDRLLFKELSGFMGWTMFNNMSVIACTQGINVVLNIFFNPMVNAARGIAVQVEQAVTMFSKNFQMAITPQIIKNYSMNERDRFEELLFSASRLSYFFLLFLAFPVLLHTDFILNIWLKEVPIYTTDFVRLILLVSLVNVLAEPLLAAVSAYGKIKYFQLVSGLLLISILPISSLGFRYIECPLLIYDVYLFISIVIYGYKLYYTKKFLAISLRQYTKRVLYRVLIVSMLCAFFYEFYFSYLSSFKERYFVLCFVISGVYVAILIGLLGLTENERKKMICYLRKWIKKGLRLGNTLSYMVYLVLFYECLKV